MHKSQKDFKVGNSHDERTLFMRFLSSQTPLRSRLTLCTFKAEQRKEKQGFFQNKKYISSLAEKKHQLNPEFTHVDQGSSKTPTFSFPEFRTELKNLLMAMTYREKLASIETLVNEAKKLSLKYGYFYITCAMIMINPQNKIKFSIWIHPNKSQKAPLHPITKQNPQKQFYITLRKVLRQLFPTISLNQAESYQNMLEQILRRKTQCRQKQRKIIFDCSEEEIKEPSSTVSSLSSDLQKELQDLFLNESNVMREGEHYAELQQELNDIL